MLYHKLPHFLEDAVIIIMNLNQLIDVTKVVPIVGRSKGLLLEQWMYLYSNMEGINIRAYSAFPLMNQQILNSVDWSCKTAFRLALKFYSFRDSSD
jgi:hypothetical protein